MNLIKSHAPVTCLLDLHPAEPKCASELRAGRCQEVEEAHSTIQLPSSRTSAITSIHAYTNVIMYKYYYNVSVMCMNLFCG